MKRFIKIWLSIFTIVAIVVVFYFSGIWLFNHLTGVQFLVIIVLLVITIVSWMAYELEKPIRY